ncbi:MAG: ComEA family DNA-binding protein [Thermoguttaceae bacterium]
MRNSNIERQIDPIGKEMPHGDQTDTSSTIDALPTPVPLPQRTHLWLLRRTDQIVVAVLAFAALLAIGIWWVAHGGLQGQIVEIDRAPKQEVRFQVDLNTAELPELIQLPGIGAKLGQRIIDSRKYERPFLKQDDLLRIRGIGAKKMERLRPYLLPLPNDKITEQKDAK